MRNRRKPFRERGFTLLEMLGVIGIIAVLAGIAVVAMKGMQRAGYDKQTKQTLSTLASMLAEYDTATALKKQPAFMFLPDGANKHTITGGDNIWLEADPASPKDAITGEQWLDAPPGAVEEEGVDPSRTRSQAVLNTAIVLREMARIPAVKTMLSQVPPEKTMNVYEDASKTILIGPVLLDGWNNPIIFVPRTGLGSVRRGEPPTNYVVRSNKVYNPASSADATALGTLAPGSRPFFASAGPDGMFGINPGGDNNPGTPDDLPAGDDNLYSFEN